ncbi:MAG: DUF58 domain-containing protein [Bacillota bacterium]
MDYPGIVKTFFWLAATYLYAHLVGGRLASFIFYISVIVIAVSVLWFKILAGIEVTCVADRKVSQVGQPVRLKISIRNKTILPVPWLRCWVEQPTTVKSEERYQCYHLSLRPRECCDFSVEIPCLIRGEFRLGNITLQSGDLFGVFEDQRVYTEELELLVLPEITLLNNKGYGETVHMAGDHTVNLKSSIRGTGLFGVRNYYSGDAMNRIHWKASARNRKLLVKEFEQQRSREMVIILDLNRDSCFGPEPETTLEKAVSIAASIAGTGLKEGNQVGLVALGEERVYLRPQTGRGHLGMVLERLARVKADATDCFADTAYRESTGFPKGARMVLVTARITPELVERLYQMAARGYHCTLILLKAETFEAGAGDEFQRTRLLSQLQGKVPVFLVSRQTDLRVNLGGVEYGAG